MLDRLIKIDGLERLRISSIEVTELNDEFLNVFKNSKILVDHLHIPLQAGSNEILHLMNRKYDLDFFENKIKQIRKLRPTISISTDVIVGFPKESEELFQTTVDTCKRIGFSKLHVFPYSERIGTAASRMDGKIDGGVKKRRARELIEVSQELEIAYMRQFINKEVDVLIEEFKDGFSFGHTGNYLQIKVKGCKDDLNKDIKVVIRENNYPYLKAETKDYNLKI